MSVRRRFGSLVRKALRPLRASPLFAVALLLTLGLAAFNGLMIGLMALRLDFLLPGPFAQMAHFTELHHRTHDLTFGFLFVPALVGVLAQVRRPTENVAGMVMTLVPSAALLVTLVLTLTLADDARILQPPWVMVMAGALIATGLHPAGRYFFRSFHVPRTDRLMLLLVLIAAVPLLGFASTNIGLQGTVPDDHAAMGHYGFMAAFAFTVIGMGLLVALRPAGWRVTGWVVGVLPVLLGVASLAYPDASSSLGRLWALGVMAWGVGFVAAVELAREAGRALLGPRDPSPERG